MLEPLLAFLKVPLAFSLGAMGSRQHNFYNQVFQRAGYADLSPLVHLALWAAYRRRGVRVVTLCPGPTTTKFFTVLGADDVPHLGGRICTPEAVIMTGLRALEKARPYAIEGWSNAFGVRLIHMLPLSLTARLFARMMRPQTKEAQPGGKRGSATPLTGSEQTVAETASKKSHT